MIHLCQLRSVINLSVMNVELKRASEAALRAYTDKGCRYRLEIGLPNIHEVRGGGTIVFITG